MPIVPQRKETRPRRYRVCASTAAQHPVPAPRPHTNQAWSSSCKGKKQISVGKTTYICDGSNFLLTSVDLPVVSQVIAATEKEPILGLLLKLEMPAVREILSQQEFHLREESADARGMAVGVTSRELLDACSRLVDLLDAPQDIPFLSSLIQREIVFRLLRSPQGKHLRAIATLGEQSHRTAKAVEWLRMN